jgi:hypothetical protein
MITCDSSQDAVRSLRSQQEKSVWSAYVKALAAATETSALLQWARNDVDEALVEFQHQQQAGASQSELQLFQERIQTLRKCRHDAEVRADEARRHADQALVSVLSAQRACAVLTKFSGAQKVPSTRHILSPDTDTSFLSEMVDELSWN